MKENIIYILKFIYDFVTLITMLFVVFQTTILVFIFICDGYALHAIICAGTTIIIMRLYRWTFEKENPEL